MKATDIQIGDWLQNTNGNIGIVRSIYRYRDFEKNELYYEIVMEYVPKDLEEAAVEYSAIGYSPFDDTYEKHQQFECSKFAFIAGAKWQKEQMISALKNGGELPTEFIDKFHEIDRTAFQNGQKNMRENMMKEAVEGIVTTRSMAGNIVTAHIDHQFKDGQKVKLIIVKEEGK